VRRFIIGLIALLLATPAFAQSGGFTIPSGGGGTPCTVTANSLQYNFSGVFGCVSGWTSDATKLLGGTAEFSDGSLSAPSVGRAASTNTGFYFGNGNVSFSSAGTAGLFVDSGVGDLQLYTTWRMGWGTGAATGSPDTFIGRAAAGLVEVGKNAALTSAGNFGSGGFVATGSPPTLTGTCTTGSQVGGNTAGTFAATCTAGTVIMTFAYTAQNGWACDAHDQSTPTDLLNQTSNTTTSATFTGTTVASDSIVFKCMAF
jgi:hypothetical protein